MSFSSSCSVVFATVYWPYLGQGVEKWTPEVLRPGGQRGSTVAVFFQLLHLEQLFPLTLPTEAIHFHRIAHLVHRCRRASFLYPVPNYVYVIYSFCVSTNVSLLCICYFLSSLGRFLELDSLPHLVKEKTVARKGNRICAESPIRSVGYLRSRSPYLSPASRPHTRPLFTYCTPSS